MEVASWEYCLSLRGDIHDEKPSLLRAEKLDFRDLPNWMKSVPRGRLMEDILAVKSILDTKGSFEKVDLHGCRLKERHISMLCTVFQDVKIGEIYLHYNTAISTNGWKHLGQICKLSSVQMLSLRRCKLSAESIEKFVCAMDGGCILSLDISLNKTIHASGWHHIGELVHQCGLRKLVAQGCELNAERLDKFRQGVDHAKIEELDLSNNSSIGEDGWLVMGQIVKQSQVTKLNAWNCEPIGNCLDNFIQGAEHGTLDDLSLSFKTNAKPSIESLFQLLPLVKEKLVLNGYPLTEEQRMQFHELLTMNHHKSLTITLDWWNLKAPPMDLPPTLSKVSKVRSRQFEDTVLYEWDPLPSDNISYCIVIEANGKAMGELIVTTETSWRLSSCQPGTEYLFFIWGFTSDSISSIASYNKTENVHETCDDDKLDSDDDDSGKESCSSQTSSVSSRKRVSESSDTEVCESKRTMSVSGAFEELALDKKPSSSMGQCDQFQHIINDRLSSPITQEKCIGQKGGCINLHGCRVEFQPQAYEANSRVSIFIRSHSSLPSGCTAASPELECKSEFPFKGHATITLPLYIFPEELDMIQVISKQTADAKWEIMKTKITVEERCVIFQVAHFTIFRAILRCVQFWKTFLSHSLYFNSTTSTLCALTCIDSESIIETCHDALVQDKFQKAFPLPSKMCLTSGKHMSYKYECIKPEECRLNPEANMTLTKQSFAGSLYHIKTFTLDPGREVPTVQLKYLLTTPQIANNVSVVTLQWNTVRQVEQLAAYHRGDAPAPLHVQNIMHSTRAFVDTHLNAGMNYHFDRDRVKGMVLIINNEFLGHGELERTGSLIDVQKLTDLCEGLGLNVRKRSNLTADGMREACAEFSRDSQNINLMVLVIMSHGGKRDGGEFFMGEDGNILSSNEVTSIFSTRNSPHLEGIPKVFVFQACRGDEIGQGIEALQGERDAMPISERNHERSDMLMVYPTQQGYAAFRHRENGSWLISAFVGVFEEYSRDTHVVDMLTRVNYVVSRRENEEGGIQRSNYLSYFTRNLYLYPGWPN